MYNVKTMSCLRKKNVKGRVQHCCESCSNVVHILRHDPSQTRANKKEEILDVVVM